MASLCRWWSKLLLWFPSVVTVTIWLPIVAWGVIRKLDALWLLNVLALWCTKFSLLISIISFTSCFSSSVVCKCFGGRDDGTDKKWLFLRLDSSLTDSAVDVCCQLLFLFSTISLLLLRSPSRVLEFVAVIWLFVWLLSTVAQNFLNFLCRYLESWDVDVDVTVDCVIIVAAAGVTSWSFGSLELSTIVRFTIVADEIRPDELLISSLVPPGSSEKYGKKNRLF